MKKTITAIVCMFLIMTISFASTVPAQDAEDILSSMGIIEGESSTTINRGELAKILAKASAYKEFAVSGIRISPFSDVPFTNEQAPYIRIVARNGIMSSYSDGEFKPNKVVTYEEAVTTILKLLGYTKEDFTIGYPISQLMIADKIGLTEGIKASIGETATREMISKLIYNALSCSTKSGKVYAETIGYSTTDGAVTLNDVMNSNVTGPVTYMGDLSSLGMTNSKVYINGKQSSEADIMKYDILYYSKDSNTIWAYREKVTGLVESILPNKETPTSVVISGNTYKLTTYLSQKAFGIGGIEAGEMATVLLDRNSQVADAYLTEELYKEQIGVIVSAGKKELTSKDGDLKNTYYVTVLLPTGEKFEVAVGSDYSKKVGYAAKVSYNQGIAKIYSTSKAENIYGTFNKDTKTIGTNKFSDNLKILEVDDYGNTISVFADRLDGVYLKKGEVALITKNSSREIENMIIKNVTGDMNKYGIVTSIKKSSNNASYNYVLDGEERTYSSNEYTFSIEKGPVQIIFDGQTITNKKNLKRVSGSVANINELYAENSSGDKYKISSDVVVYDMSGTTVMEATMEDAINSEGYVSAYYDKSEKDGGLIRVISIN